MKSEYSKFISNPENQGGLNLSYDAFRARKSRLFKWMDLMKERHPELMGSGFYWASEFLDREQDKRKPEITVEMLELAVALGLCQKNFDGQYSFQMPTEKIENAQRRLVSSGKILIQ